MTAEMSLKELLEELAEKRGFDFRGYKRSSLERRFRRRMFQLSVSSYGSYGEYIRQHPDEINRLLTTILINVTEFFRDPPAWEILRHEILPKLLKGLKPGNAFRAWSAGCASGEEAYSIAILLADYFGPRISEYDVKIYATDIDEEELVIARRGEYSAEALRRLKPEWREKYFNGKGMLRVNRDIRRLVIFGCSNLGQDAPISHVNLLVCRNVLIYFDSALQRHIMERLHFALDPGGILFLGKSESQLTNSSQFRRLNPRWRIFQRMNLEMRHQPESAAAQPDDGGVLPGTQQELESLRLQQRHLLETLRVGAIILSPDDVILHNNNAMMSTFGLPPANLEGRRLRDVDLFARTPDLAAQLEECHTTNEPVRFQNRVKVGTSDRLLEITLRPIFDAGGERNGTFIYCDDVTIAEKLQDTVEELQSTSEELQSANEELETTNEELQSTNEELETTNEELQSTNEELETTNEELQSLNEELETTNQELEERTKELDQVNTVYVQILEEMRLPVMVVNGERRIEFWNSMALRLFGFRSKPPVDLHLEQLPLPESQRTMIVRRLTAVLIKHTPVIARNQAIGQNGRRFDVHFSAVPHDDHSSKILVMFEAKGERVLREKDAGAGNGARRSKTKRKASR